MDLHQFSDGLSATPLSQLIQTTTWMIPAIQTVHLVALALVFTAGLVLALRVLGFGLTVEPLGVLTARLAKLIGWLLLLLLASGGLLIVAEPGRTITNPMFYAKMIMLAAVILMTLWLRAGARRMEHGSGLQRVLASATVVLWVGIIFAGRFIAYYESN